MWTLIPGDWRPKSTEWLIRRMEPIAANAQRWLSRTPNETEACHCEPRPGRDKLSEESAVRHDRDEKQIPRASLPQAGKPALGRTTGGDAQGSADGIQEATASGTGDILCLHDGYHRQLNADRTHTLAALEHWLPRWRDLGLEFVTMDEAVR